MGQSEVSLGDIMRAREEGAEIADLEESVMGQPRKYLLMAFEVYDNGTTAGKPVEDPGVARLIGEQCGIGPPTDPVGFGIWSVDQISERRQ